MNEFARFLAVGVVNTVLGYGIIFGCMYLASMGPEVSNAAGYAVGLLASYVLNKHYTFNSTEKSAQEIIRFIAVFCVAYSANIAMLCICIHHIGVSNLNPA